MGRSRGRRWPQLRRDHGSPPDRRREGGCTSGQGPTGLRASILIAGAALALAAPAAAHPDRGEHHRDHDRYESPYSNEAMRIERERKEFARETAKADREE